MSRASAPVAGRGRGDGCQFFLQQTPRTPVERGDYPTRIKIYLKFRP